MESGMKTRGEERVWKTIFSKTHLAKKVVSIQQGQQMIFAEAIRLLPLVSEWVKKGVAQCHKKEIGSVFFSDEILLEKITATMFLLTASITAIKHKEAGNISRYKHIKIVNEKLLPDLKPENVWRFIEVIIDLSIYFESKKESKKEDRKNITTVFYECTLQEEIREKLENQAFQAFFPEPMTKPPVPWSFENQTLKGGYETHQYDFVRSSEDVDYSLQSQNIFDVANYIQSVPWTVNKQALSTIKQDLKAPEKKDYIFAEYPDAKDCSFDIKLKEAHGLSPDVVEKIQSKRAVFQDLLDIYNAQKTEFESALGKYRALKLAVSIADRYKDEDTLYFPHSFDSRGRIYPIPVGLSPQGSDAVKAMLEYKNGEILNPDGEAWAWSYLTSLYGEDKKVFEERVKRGKELINTNYLEADEPYQFLAHQIELKKFMLDKNHIFKARVHLDACNSGSQFTSAITGDMAGCIATNVYPSIEKDGAQSRQDAYILVANKSLALTNEMIFSAEFSERREELEYFATILDKNGRKVCKRPVMVSNYGGTAAGRSTIIYNQMRELKCDNKYIKKEITSLYSKVIGDSIAGVLNGGKAFESYIQKMSNLITSEDNSIYWTTSDGFHIVHRKNKELKPRQVKILLPGSRRETEILSKTYSKNVSPAKMKSAISPNVIHSFDAELLRCTATKMQQFGIFDTDWIHDSFGSHPNNVDVMLNITKDEFKKLVLRNPLQKLDKELRLQLPDNEKIQKRASKIQVPILGLIEKTVEKVEISDWFFS